MQVLVVPFLNLILFFYHLLGNNLGWSIIAITILLNLILYPLTRSSLKMAKKQQTLKPKLDELKAAHKDNKTKLFEEQSKLLKEEGINPAAGCLPAIAQILIIIVLIRAFSGVLNGGVDAVSALNQVAYSPSLRVEEGNFNTQFYSIDLTEKNILLYIGSVPIPGLLVILSAVLQFFSAKMMLPDLKKEKEVSKTTETKSDDVAADFQKQMVYIFPLIYLWIGTQYPSGLALYFLISSLFSVLRYYSMFGRVTSKVDK